MQRGVLKDRHAPEDNAVFESLGSGFSPTEGPNAMRDALHGLPVLGGCLLLAAVAAAAQPTAPVPTEAVPATPEDREIQILMDQLGKLNDFIRKGAESPQG